LHVDPQAIGGVAFVEFEDVSAGAAHAVTHLVGNDPEWDTVVRTRRVRNVKD